MYNTVVHNSIFY